MSAAVLQNPIFTDEAKAREWLEARVWPNGPTCPHCGVTHEHVTSLNGKAHRPGVYQCNECREQFTVTVKTVFERSKIPLTKWLAALFLLTASKKGMSSHQMHRMLGISYKSTWFMTHRLREAMKTGLSLPPMGGFGKTIEVDETFIGRLEGAPKQKRRGGTTSHKNTVLTLVERGGSARSFHVDGTTVADIAPILKANISRMSRLNTDEAKHYHEVGGEFVAHEAVNHGEKEYVRYEDARLISTNTVEGFYSIFKRGMKGVYQHCAEKHLHRYLAEFDFRYSNRVALGTNDEARAEKLAKGIVGKRLTYRRPNKVSDAPPF
jgi:transposase-like protein